MRKLSQRDKSRLAAIIAAHSEVLTAIDGFVDAQPGFPIVDGRVIKQPAIIVYVALKRPESRLPRAAVAPRSLEGIRVDVVQADPERQLRKHPATRALAAALDVATAELTYKPLPGSPIDTEIEVEKPILCHVGPDAGWPTLKPFLEGTTSTLSVAMYDFNADWISKAFVEAMKANDVKVTLTWDDGMNAEETAVRRYIKRELGDKLDAWIVACGGSRRFASAYHEKVAVRDSKSMWISSGNWSRRSQPDIDPVGNPEDVRGMYSAGNREWHAILHDAALAKLFQKYIRYDRDQSEKEDTALGVAERTEYPDLFVPLDAFQMHELSLAATQPVAPARLPSHAGPVKVWPLLTPDNYREKVLHWVQSAKRSLYLQFAYITYSDAAKDAKFSALLDAIAEKSYDDTLDVKIIVGSADAQEKVARLVENGFNDAVIRVQSNVHNKGIVVDGKSVLVSSANWSGDGVLRNRDAGIIIHDAEIAAYYERVFLDDWNHRARARLDGSGTAARLALPGEPVPPGMVRMSWAEFYGE